MQRPIIRSLVISGVIMCIIGIGSSQLTLSKGWGPGKRSLYEENSKLRTKSVTAYWHTLVSELKRLVACERRRIAYEQPGDEIRMNQIESMNVRLKKRHKLSANRLTYQM